MEAVLAYEEGIGRECGVPVLGEALKDLARVDEGLVVKVRGGRKPDDERFPFGVELVHELARKVEVRDLLDREECRVLVPSSEETVEVEKRGR